MLCRLQKSIVSILFIITSCIWRYRLNPFFLSFLYIFWRARVCRPLLCLCRPFMIFERCLDSNPEYCRSKLARYRLSHPSLLLSMVILRIQSDIMCHINPNSYSAWLGTVDRQCSAYLLDMRNHPIPLLNGGNKKELAKLPFALF